MGKVNFIGTIKLFHGEYADVQYMYNVIQYITVPVPFALFYICPLRAPQGGVTAVLGKSSENTLWVFVCCLSR